MNSRKLLKEVLDYFTQPGVKPIREYEALRERIKAELEQPEAEPVGTISSDQFYVGKRDSVGNIFVPLVNIDAIPSGTKLYANLQRRAPLGEAELLETIKPHCGSYEMMGIRIARAIERRHGIGSQK